MQISFQQNVLTSAMISALLLATLIVAPLSAQSVARQWNETLLDAIRMDFPAPTVHARNLYHTSAAMYDAWAAFDPYASGHLYTEKHAFEKELSSAQDEAISYAAYRVLSSRYQLSVDPEASRDLFDNLMRTMGYDISITTTTGNSGAAVGNRIAEQILANTLADGSNEANRYVDNTGYEPSNEPMVVDFPGVNSPGDPPLNDPNRWQPLFVESGITQNGLEGESLQEYIGAHWGDVTTFALGRGGNGPKSWSHIDPGPAPQFGSQEYTDDSMLVVRYSNSLDPTQGPGQEQINISPSVAGNRPLGTHNDQGYDVNPVTGQPYADNMVRQADYGRILAEFWADGPDSETPPGHWNTIANSVSDNALLEKRIGGTGDTVSDTEWDVKLYLALNGATHDAAVAAWGIKREYDYVRPITKIRYQASLGQSTDVNGVKYHVNGLPLETDLVEQITAGSVAEGGKHRNAYVNANQDADGNFMELYTEAEMVGKVVINAWNHEPNDPESELSGIDWILAENWVPYQDDNFVTPAFAAYVSGHSTFSRAAAEVLTAFTGSQYFPGGLGEASFAPGWLEFENGPQDEVTLQWATYFDAADEAGISRLWGGIHVPADDFAGRIIGASVGIDAFAYAKGHFVADDLDWNNPIIEADVNFSGVISPLDALLVINELNNRVISDDLTGLLPTLGEDELPTSFLDVNDDGFVGPLDALLVINALPDSVAPPNAALSVAVSVPEPTAWILVLTSLSLILRLRIIGGYFSNQHVLDP